MKTPMSDLPKLLLKNVVTVALEIANQSLAVVDDAFMNDLLLFAAVARSRKVLLDGTGEILDPSGKSSR